MGAEPNSTAKSDTHYDLIVIGGGAAGFFTAIRTAELLQESYTTASILILERSDKVLQKVKISGGGRCNVTHSCFDPKALSTHYPRGEKSLIGPFHHFQPQNMIDWLAERGVELKTEPDGRMFPLTDSSQTIIDCLQTAASNHHIKIKTNAEVTSIESAESNDSDDSPNTPHLLTLTNGKTHRCHHLMIATGGTRLNASETLTKSLGHNLAPPVPSLFTFNIKDPRLADIAGLSVQSAHVQVKIKEKTKAQSPSLQATGPVLVTHWGLSGPAILKLSAWGARALSELDYKFTLTVDWSPAESFEESLKTQRDSYGKRSVIKRSPLPAIPRRLWEKLCHAASISPETTWAQLTKTQTDALASQVHYSSFQTNGKSLNKDEFVTCGGVPLKEIHPKSYESRLRPRIHFAGEVLDIDGITGGFNFQNAWTSAHLAATSIATSILSGSEI